MTTPAYCFTNLKLNMDERPEEITICCNGKITAESTYMFQREVRGHAIAESRGKGVAGICRIVLDLSNVTQIDNAGLEALLDVCKAGQQKSCSVEIINHGLSANKRPATARFDLMFRKMQAMFS